MDNPNLLPSDRAKLAAVINPQSVVGATVTSGWVSMKTYGTILALVQAGAIAASALVDAKLEQATSSGGAGAKDITGKSITQLVGTDDNKQAEINLRAEELDVQNNYAYVRLSITVGDTASPDAAAALVSGAIRGFNARYQPATAVASLAQVVA